MARIRTLKPGFFTNDLLAEIPPIGRLLFQGLWCIADREGRLEDRPKRIKAEVLPYDDCDVDPLLDELARLGFIERYASGEQRYIQVTNFGKHQTPHIKEAASTIPAPCKHDTSTVLAPKEAVASTPSIGNLDPVVGSSSGNLDPLVGVRRPPAALPLAQPPTPAPKAPTTRAKGATPAPDSFPISDDMRAWADDHAPGVDVDRETERFLDRNRASGTTYKDWHAAWRNWLTSPYAKPQQLRPSSRAPDLQTVNGVAMSPRMARNLRVLQETEL